MKISTLENIKKIDAKVQSLISLLNQMHGPDSGEVRAFEAEYNNLLMRIGDAVRIEHQDLDAESAQKLPLSTPLGLNSSMAFIEIIEWLNLQMKLATDPVS